MRETSSGDLCIIGCVIQVICLGPNVRGCSRQGNEAKARAGTGTGGACEGQVIGRAGENAHQWPSGRVAVGRDVHVGRWSSKKPMGSDHDGQKDKSVRDANPPEGRKPSASDQQRGSWLRAKGRSKGAWGAISH